MGPRPRRRPLDQHEIDAIQDSFLRIGMKIARQVFEGQRRKAIAVEESELSGIAAAAAQTATELHCAELIAACEELLKEYPECGCAADVPDSKGQVCGACMARAAIENAKVQ